MNLLQIIILIFFIGFQSSVYSQNESLYDNKLMTELRDKFVELEDEFMRLNFTEPVLSLRQGTANYVKIQKDDLSDAITDVRNNLPFDEFILKYPEATSKENLIVIVNSIQENAQLEVKSVPFNSYNRYSITGSLSSGTLEEQNSFTWFYTYYNTSDKSEQILSAFYLLSDLKTYTLPEEFAQMVRYSNFMIDNDSNIFKDGSISVSSARYLDSPIDKFSYRIEGLVSENDPTRYLSIDEKKKSGKFITNLDSIRIAVFSDPRYSDELNKLFDEAYNFVNKNGDYNFSFSRYVGLLKSKEEELDLLRSFRVIGQCSQDDFPKFQLSKIAITHAELGNARSFLKLHLEIMNDRVSRMIDASYSQRFRVTYMDELKSLGLDNRNLLLGISLQTSSYSNGYLGNLYRIGRAISESDEHEMFETNILKMINNDSLDLLNRRIMVALYRNYISFLKEEELVQSKNEILNAAISDLPEKIRIFFE